MDKIRTGLVGCGKVGHLHAKALQSLEESEFVAVCSRDPRRAGNFAETYRVEAYISYQGKSRGWIFSNPIFVAE